MTTTTSQSKEEPPSIHGATPASSRWTPTKEQINILESLYKQGIRTPTADQIQQITNRLKDYGTIEGKNVFYWFQNHKARQRQKQKQEVAAAYFSNFYHHPSPPPPPPPPSTTTPLPLFSPPNGCRVVTIQPTAALEYGFHGMNNMMMTPKVLLPGAVKRKSADFQPYMDNKGGDTHTLHGHYRHRLGMVGGDDHQRGQRLNHSSVGYTNGSTSSSTNINVGKQYTCDDGGTLRLFPLEPTGGKAAGEVGEESWSGITAVDDDDEEEMKGRRFFDFFNL